MSRGAPLKPASGLVSEKSRQALALKREGLTRAQVAERFGVSVATIDNWLAAARVEERGR